MVLSESQLGFSVLIAVVVLLISRNLSFAKWILGELFVYLPPTSETLKNAEGIKDEKNKKKQKGPVPDYKISKSVDVPLEVISVNSDFLIQLNFYPEFQWLLNFMAFTTVVYMANEAYLFWRPSISEINMSILWCLLVSSFVTKTLMAVSKIYFKSDETSAERSMCLVLGLVYLLIAMLILLVDEKWLEFGLRDAYDSFRSSARMLNKEITLESSGPMSELIFKLSLAGVAGFFGALFVFPGVRFAQMHRDLLNSEDVGIIPKLMIHLNFIAPFLILVSWIPIVSRELITVHTFSGMKAPLLTGEQFETARIVFVIFACFLRLWLTGRYMQSYLNLAFKKVANLRKEAGRIQISEYRRTISSVYNYSCVVALQYVAPTVLLLFCCLLLKTLGRYSWLGEPGMTLVADPVSDNPFTLHRVLGFLTPTVFRGTLNFLTWWTSAIIFSNSIIGYAFYAYNEKQ